MKVAVAGLGYRMANVLQSFQKAIPDLTIVGLVERRYAGDESDHYSADDQMTADIAENLLRGTRLPVDVIDALEAGLTAIKIDEARRDRRVIEMADTWAKFDAALQGVPVKAAA